MLMYTEFVGPASAKCMYINAAGGRFGGSLCRFRDFLTDAHLRVFAVVKSHLLFSSMLISLDSVPHGIRHHASRRALIM